MNCKSNSYPSHSVEHASEESAIRDLVAEIRIDAISHGRAHCRHSANQTLVESHRSVVHVVLVDDLRMR
jgi:hypothetical protein